MHSSLTYTVLTVYTYFFPHRNEKALKNFNDANFYLRGNKLINYQQLGLKSKLYMCEVRINLFFRNFSFLL